MCCSDLSKFYIRETKGHFTTGSIDHSQKPSGIQGCVADCNSCRENKSSRDEFSITGFGLNNNKERTDMAL